MSWLSVAATQPSALEKLQKIPPAFWLKLGIAVAVVIGVVFVLRFIGRMNKVILAVVLIVAFTAIGFNWIYQRNEPAWATPVVEKLADFFPSKGSYASKQQTSPRP